MRDLSVLIPSRNEMFLRNTVEDILANIEADTEIIVVCDGGWPVETIADHPRVTLVHRPKSIGQRAATNEAARLSRAKFIMKLDAHCSVDKGFDRKLIADCEYDWTAVPRMYNLHVFDWMCKACQHRTYQGPTPTVCVLCGKSEGFERAIVWKRRRHKLTTAYRFDRDLHFRYWTEFQKRPEGLPEIADTMSLIGACWMMNRERYWQLGGLDESHGSWGQMGTEIACKTWLSGGRLIVNKKTHFSHMFRTQGGDFGFPYPISGSDQERARKHSRKLWLDGTWPGAKYPLSWLIEKFRPIPDWHDEEIKEAARGISRPSNPITKGIIYYTDNQCPDPIAEAVQRQLLRCSNGHPIVSASLKPLDFGENIVIERKRGIKTMFLQILAALEKSTADVIFFAEHDVIYHPSHLDFTPPAKDVFYYNENVWKVDAASGRALHYLCKQTSGLCAYRELLVEHYRKRIAKIDQNAADLIARGERVKSDGFSRHMGFEPGTHRYPRGVDRYKAERWMSEHPNVDIRHGGNLTPSRWKQSEFRNPDACLGWTEGEAIPGWGKTLGRFNEFLAELD